ncbi:MAG: hypothetical protein ACRDNS_02860, partial [Trebonia sp.]
GGAVLGASQGGGRHDYALLLLGAFAIVALAVAVLSGSRPAAIAVGVAGAIALLLFLLIDLPDAGATGLFGALVPGKAHPRGGYWLELIGAVVLLLGGAGLATVTGPVRTKLGEDPATMRGRA